jgi:hypothetical protein
LGSVDFLFLKQKNKLKMGFVIPSERRLWGGVGFAEIFTKAWHR